MLKDFYVALQDWIDKPNENPCGFRTTYGLCDNLEVWCCAQGLSLGQSSPLKACLKKSFKEAGLHPVYPFNRSSIADFSKETITQARYKNPARLKFDCRSRPARTPIRYISDISLNPEKSRKF